MASRPQSSRGFTLIELLVAITVLAIVAVLGWRGLDGIVRARFALSNDLEQTRGMQLAFAQMQNDCARIANARELLLRSAITADNDRLTLVRNVFTEGQPSRVQVVAYRVVDGVLQRRESVPTRDAKEIDRLWRAAQADADRENQPVSLQHDVASMMIRTWNGPAGWQGGPDTGGKGGDANNNANNANNTQLGTTVAESRGIEVTLQVSSNGHPGKMTKIFLLGAE
jgi:general secretion pathway protein J